ncbi:putative polysaccharide deacetylase; putative Chitin deacetylase [Bradyrhizobium sp. ORS 285]|uniref:polysaccharide deacetylase family protein n=1 Tax=Bradyrhizobium sp. ORS 285 TaxID=115808 RepID=UPI0002406122|nr:polysaccharide deacetylase family protein [Bradyrhizobium sp. ORS 285]CCD83673.1 putative polysaccharide deacetylase; putative Chitin deacetylase [Bradyrhizobium sp. ORS 285]SMX59218.1 putative polysaccharide deacetylase; putative Chitin deacetylase [Bradyrhizobium sp. ORS 285]
MTGWVNAAGALAALLVMHGACAEPAPCPREGTLGTSRVLSVNPKNYPRVGLKSFPDTLPLEDGEVILTFDDGPSPPMTNKVLAALARECVRATFFLVGQPASGRAELVRKIAAEGHTVGHHTYTHAHLAHITPEQAVDEIDRGIAADEKALNGAETTTPSTPFFRFPYFESTPATLELLQSRGIAVFGADFWASDWTAMSPQQTLKLLVKRLNLARKGIILLHDPQPRTVAMLPAFLRYLKDHGYRVVHIVPAKSETAAEPQTDQHSGEQHSGSPSPAEPHGGG